MLTELLFILMHTNSYKTVVSLFVKASITKENFNPFGVIEIQKMNCFSKTYKIKSSNVIIPSKYESFTNIRITKGFVGS
jgi:hypothetical protein